MITKRDKVQIVLRDDELMVLRKARDILEDYVNNCNNDDLDDLNVQIFEYAGVECAVGGSVDTLTYICSQAVVED